MTLRAILLGFMGAATVCGVSFFNDRILRQTYLVGNNMPVSVYGALILFVVLINPRLKKHALKGAELAVIMTLTLAACCIPGSGLLRTFTSSLILPNHYSKTNPGWRQQQIVETLPQRLMPDLSKNEEEVLGGFVQGLSEGGGHISPAQVPWSAWVTPILIWIPLILTLWIGLIALSVLIHKQWSEHEHLPYPVTTFANFLLPEEGDAVTPLFRNRLFWIGAMAVLFLYMNNYAYCWFPKYLIEIPTRFSFAPLGQFFPTITKGGGWGLFSPSFYFVVIGMCFFIPSDLALTFGLGPWLWALVAGLFVNYGINLNNVLEGSYYYTGLKPRSFILFGANIGLFAALLYSGRHYYLQVFRRAIGLKGSDEADAASAWSCRAFLGLMVLFTVQLCLIGLDWQLAVMYTAVLVIFYVVMTRIIAESGLFHLQSNIFPCVMIWGFLGAQVLGPKTLLLMQVISMVLVIDPRESLMPFMANSLKLIELQRQSIGKAGLLCVGAVLIGIIVGLPVTLYIQYDQGNAIWESWAEQAVPTMQFDNAIAVKRKLDAQGMLEQSEQVTGWARFRHMSPNGPCMWSVVAGCALVLLFTACRLRFPWWPLHPLLFVTWCTTHIAAFAGSFLMGWFLKVVVLKYGGNATYNRLRPLVLGVMAGEILAAVIPSIVGAIYYFVTGQQPKPFFVLLG
ncbi:MAG: hypothetical protein A3K19_10000 [Lentisphaerae bacterium RIFOXYB12_FULL_65_16]|nr:MAG: hypothetical protein A3K18_00735 [Lentisphaerae bacterium RIFOXYA12_64_32]OGV91282.1 MAG: hypothetical protein A3K19_10000 [Lentisphaerae bacterium RIFOXYB12_FULL_65_16]